MLNVRNSNITQDINVIPADKPEKFRLGWVDNTAHLKFGYMLGNLLEEGNQQERSIMSDVMEILRDYTPNTSKSDDIVRTANINKIAEPDRNDLVSSLKR